MKQFYYGGQAVIEGVLIRGRQTASLAVRRSDGLIWTGSLPLTSLYNAKLRQIPVIRGVIVLIETMFLGIQALHRSAEISMIPPEKLTSDSQELPRGEKMNRGAIIGSMVISIGLGVGIFLLLPLFGARSLDSVIDHSVLTNAIEGVLRLGLLIGYIWAIGHMEDIRRVFAYHGAEHMTIHAYEHGVSLEPDNIAKFPKAHSRCGTAFLLTVVVVSIFVFTALGRPEMMVAIASRILLIPVIAGISYEFLRFTAAYSQHLFGRIAATPGLALQSLTTRYPDYEQIEVAIAALKHALDGDSVETASSDSGKNPVN